MYFISLLTEAKQPIWLCCTCKRYLGGECRSLPIVMRYMTDATFDGNERNEKTFEFLEFEPI